MVNYIIEILSRQGFVNIYSFLSVVACHDNVTKGFLEGSSTNEEPVDVFLSDELVCVFISYTATIEDPGLVSC